MPAPAAIMAGVSVGSAIFGGIMGIGGAKSAKKAAKAAARFKELENLEAQRRKGLADEQVLGRARASAASSGAILDSAAGATSTSRYVNELKGEFNREMMWMKEAGRLEVGAIRKGASVQYRGDMANAILNTVGGVQNAVKSWYGIP